ncbi:MAG TPA: NAD(P)-dependent oxidoreductase [Bryobacteraceae bacterium]|nr:NAD(P)-dependent oxidoreductase [Bryobacteraceae bacterium]
MSLFHAQLSAAGLEAAFADLHPAFTPQEAVVEANRCLFCFDAPCTNACPTHIDVPRFIKKIATENLRGSALTILHANMLGLSCSRICPVDVLCQGACVMHRYNRKPIEIGRLQRRAMEHFYDTGAKLPPQEVEAKRQRIACIGAGPASLACAAELRRQGYAVTIFEAQSLGGGLNTHGVAEYKLRAPDSLREVEFIRSLGVEIRTGVCIGEDIALEQLDQEYDAIFLGVGLGPTEKINIPGEDGQNVMDAVSFIAAYKVSKQVTVGRRTVILGGGNTAIDAAVAARRLGAEEAAIVYRREEHDLPAFGFEYEHAKENGIRFFWRTLPVAIRETGVECVRTEPGAADATGRSTPEPVAGSNFLIPCDLVIVALGQAKLTSLLADRANPLTDNPKYFAGGDCANGGREVVDAAAEGKRAAQGIAAWLEKRCG